METDTKKNSFPTIYSDSGQIVASVWDPSKSSTSNHTNYYNKIVWSNDDIALQFISYKDETEEIINSLQKIQETIMQERDIFENQVLKLADENTMK